MVAVTSLEFYLLVQFRLPSVLSALGSRLSSVDFRWNGFSLSLKVLSLNYRLRPTHLIVNDSQHFSFSTKQMSN